MNKKSLNSNWINSAKWDGFWIFNIYWIVIFFGFIHILQDSIGIKLINENQNVWPTLGIVILIVTIGKLHRFSSIYTVYFTPLFKEIREKQVNLFRNIPLAIVIGTILISILGALDMNLPTENHSYQEKYFFFLLIINIYFIWDNWHFAAQHFGILSLYRNKKGQSSPVDRRVDLIYTYTVVFFVNFFIMVFSFTPKWHAKFLYPFITGEQEQVEKLKLLALTVGITLTISVIIFELLKKNRSIQKVFYYLQLGIMTTVLYLTLPKYFIYVLIVHSLNHFIAACGITYKVPFEYFKKNNSFSKKELKKTNLNLYSLKKMLLIILPITALFWLLNVYFGVYNVQAFKSQPLDKYLIERLYSNQLLSGFIFGIFWAYDFMHYYCDRRIFHFRDKETREAVAPHLLN